MFPTRFNSVKMACELSRQLNSQSLVLNKFIKTCYKQFSFWKKVFTLENGSLDTGPALLAPPHAVGISRGSYASDCKSDCVKSDFGEYRISKLS